MTLTAVEGHGVGTVKTRVCDTTAAQTLQLYGVIFVPQSQACDGAFGAQKKTN